MTNVIPPVLHLPMASRSPNRAEWIAWLCHRSHIEPHELFIAMMIGATRDWRQWPLISLEAQKIADRLGVDRWDIDQITDGLAKQGFLRNLQEVDTLDRRRFLAILPPLLPGEREKW